MTYSTDFRRKVLEIKGEENLTITETAKRFKIGATESGIHNALKCLGISKKTPRHPKANNEARQPAKTR